MMKNKTQEELLRDIMKLSFAALETNLYLDTHPTNKKALLYFKKTNEALKNLKKEYESTYGPITADGCENEKEWLWSTQKWPWQMEE